jgi:hypothetical protein
MNLVTVVDGGIDVDWPLCVVIEKSHSRWMIKSGCHIEIVKGKENV